MTKIQNALNFMADIANNNSHGYDQINRWGPDYDCSSLVITALEQAGIPVKSNGATYTGNMESALKKCGFVNVVDKVNLATGKGLRKGDVLLNKRHHTEMYYGNGKAVGASINEQGKAVGGKTGDQTGREIRIHNYYNYPWDSVWRYPESENRKSLTQAQSTKANSSKTYFCKDFKNGKQYEVTASELNMRVDAPNGRIISVLPKGEKVMWYGYYKSINGVLWLWVASSKGKVGYCCSKYLNDV